MDALEKAKRNLDNLEMDDLEHRVAVARLRKVAQQCANAMYELAPLRPTLNEELATARAKVGELSAKVRGVLWYGGCCVSYTCMGVHICVIHVWCVALYMYGVLQTMAVQ